MDTPQLPQPGDRVGNYIVDEEIGRGAFGVVYKAHHHTLRDQLVALKVPTNEDVREIMRGGAIQYRVDHPGVVRVVDLDPSSEPPFMAMEWVEGQTLRAMMDEIGKLNVDEALPILDQILAALETAHDRGVVHRDLKPAQHPD